MTKPIALPEIFDELDLLDAQFLTVQHLARLLEQVVRDPSSRQIEIVSRALCDAALAENADDALDIVTDALRRLEATPGQPANKHVEVSHD